MREAVQVKARRYLGEGRLRVLEVDEHAGTALAECRGNGALYTVRRDERGWTCDCPARVTCAHLVALQLVTALEPREGSMSEARLTASEWASMMRASLRDKSYQLTELGPAVTDFLAWKRLDGAAERTLDQYERDLSRACVLFPEKTLETIASEDLLHVVTVFPAPLAEARPGGARLLLRDSLGANRPKPDGSHPESATAARTLRRGVHRSGGGGALESPHLRDRALMTILFDAGLRKAEARHLRGGRCLLAERQIVVVSGKGGKDRVIPMSARLTSALADLFLTEGIEAEDFLWYGARGNQYGYKAVSRSRPIGEGTFHRWWERALEEAGVRYRNAHVARHTFATRWLKRGGRIETLSKAMGHASIATTVDLYGHLDLSDVARDLALIEAYGINPERGEE